MSNASTYSVWVTVTIAHKYFNKSMSFISLIPTQDTVIAFKKSGLIFRQKDNNTWVIISNNNTDIEPGALLEFYLKVTDKDFYYYTDIMEKTECKGCSITDADMPGIWKKLMISEGIQKGKNAIAEVIINSAGKYLEFYVFATDAKARVISLKEENGRIDFVSSEESFPGEQGNSIRFVSSKPVVLQREHGYSIGLWEKKESGEVLLSNCLPFPAVDSASAISPKDTVSSYFYF